MDMTDQNIQPVNTAAPDKVLIKQKLKKAYSYAGLAMILQLVITNVIQIASMMTYTVPLQGKLRSENPGISLPDISAKVQDAVAAHPFISILCIAIGYLIANPATFLMMCSKLGAFKASDTLRKPKPVSLIGVGIFSVLGIQAVSMFIQIALTLLSGVRGINDSTAANMSFDGTAVKTVILIVYMVIVAPITEEMLCRGFVLNALSPVSRTFALIASSMIFGIMHGNFNQMFNGFILGLMLGYLALKSGSILTSIAAHMLCNANAMFMSYVYEYKIGGDVGSTAEVIHLCVTFVLGIIALVFFLKKNGKISEDKDIITEKFRIDIPNEKGELTWKIFLTRASFWIFAAIYVVIAISMLTPVAQGAN